MMVPLPKPDVILTHESDLDGLVSGLLLQDLAHKLFGVRVRLEAYHYHAWRQRSPRENAAWVCDLAFEPRLDKLNWVVIDHHPTEARPKTGLLVHDVQKSASLLCYLLCKAHELESPVLDRLVHLTNVGDLFLENDPDFTLAGDYANLVKSYGFWNLHALIGGRLEKLIDHPLLEVMAVKRRVEDPLGFAWSKENIIEISPTVGFVDTVIGNNNLIIHQLLEQQATPYPVLVTMFRKPAGSMILSFRSRNGGALKVAERLQGGGHPNACGATLPRSVQSVSEAIEYVRKVLNPPPARSSPLNGLEELFAEIEATRK
jgi:oligoribonuclease NrnB/cAMP/cGMP phosphodiesterase (DHH superfamily)